MDRYYLSFGVMAALLLACGCSKSKPPEVSSWFKAGTKKDAPVAKNSPEQLQRDLKNKLQKLSDKLAKVEEVLASAKNSQKRIAKELNQRGVKGLDDLEQERFKNNENVQHLKTELLKNLEEQARFQRMIEEYSTAKLDGELTLERLERAMKLAQVGISDKEMDEFAITVAKIDERLKAPEGGQPVELPKGNTSALDKALKSAGD